MRPGEGVRNVALLMLTCLLGPHSRAQDYLHQAASGIQALQQWYDPATGLYRSAGWWNSANAITVLIDYLKLHPQIDLLNRVENAFTRTQKNHPRFLNEYYDDEGWWALAWIDAYDLTGRRRFLHTSEAIFANMAEGWDDQSCGGGIWWSKSHKYKNAIANELFLSVAARLANRSSGTKRLMYLRWAAREWTWFQDSGMINSKGLINDGLGRGCQNNNGTVWTYNQGVILGGLVELSKLQRNPALLEQAQGIAAAALRSLTNEHGILHDPCEPRCNTDAVQFKGVFVRNLSALQQTSPKDDYRHFIEANAASILARDRNASGQFGQVWSGPVSRATAATQSSALDAIIAAARDSATLTAPLTASRSTHAGDPRVAGRTRWRPIRDSAHRPCETGVPLRQQSPHE